MPTFEEYIKQGEMATEHQQHPEAMQAYTMAILTAANNKNYEQVVQALGQRLIIYKHKWQLSGDAVFLELLKGDADTGTAIVEKYSLEGHSKAVMLLRSGDYFYENKNYSEAANNYANAVDNLPEGDIAQPEFLGHLGVALCLSGDNGGLEKLNTALNLAEADRNLRPFHKIIIISGIQMRLAESEYAFGNIEKAKEHLEIAFQLGKELESEHNIGMRTVQIKNLKDKLNL